MTVRLRDTVRVGALARTLIDKGANVFEGIDFAIADPQRPMDELRVAATTDATRKAKLSAEAAGVRLVRGLSIDPDPDSAAPGPADRPRTGPPPAGSATTVIPVEPGLARINAKVTIACEIRPSDRIPIR